MIESPFRYLILVLGGSACESECAEAVRKREFYRESHFVCEGGGKKNNQKRYCILACSLRKTSFSLISSKLILFTSDLAWTELQIEKDNLK